MPLYAQTVKNLIAGVSQQPAVLRSPEQLEEQLNGFSTEVAGLQKRPPTLHVKTLTGVTLDDTAEPLLHYINRDASEKYMMILTNGKVQVCDLAGNMKTVRVDGDANPAYLKTAHPRKDIRLLTLGDYTFIINKNIRVQMSSDTTPDYFATQGVLVHVKSGQYGRTYEVWLDGNKCGTYTTRNGGDASHTADIDTQNIVSKLAESIRNTTTGTKQRAAGSYPVGAIVYYGGKYYKRLDYSIAGGNPMGTAWMLIRLERQAPDITPELWKVTSEPASPYVVEEGDSWLRIKNAYNVDTRDGFNNQAMVGIKDSVQRFSLLPATAPADYYVKVKGDPNGQEGGSYYVRYNASEKVWEECAQAGISCGLDPKTMPHALVREADGTFHLRTVEWSEREVGDEDSNPLPSFVGQTLSDIFFFRNRMGFTSGENIILSESGEFFNFWMTTANDLLDTDCIDIPATSSKVNILHYAVPFNEDLYAFSSDTQFVLRVDSVLSPKNVALLEVTSYSSSPGCRPEIAGRNLYFPSERAEYTSIREYYTVESVSDVKAAQDITSHVPSYIPNSVHKIIPANSENMLFCLSSGATSSLFVYKYLFIDEKRAQSSWSRWDVGAPIFGGFFADSKLYLLVKYGGKVVLECINFTFETTDYDEEDSRVYLDHKRVISTVVYDEKYERSTFNVKSEYATSTIEGLKRIGLVSEGVYKEIEVSADGTFTLDGDYRGRDIIIGVPYIFRATLGTIYVRRSDQSGNSLTMTAGRLQIRRIQMHYSNTGGFIAKVTLAGGKQYTYKMTGRVLGHSGSSLGVLPRDTGSFKFPVQSLNENCTITIESDMPLPVALVGYLWEGNYIQRTRGG